MLQIRWRPSGGRGEYEYIAHHDSVLDKSIVIHPPCTTAQIDTAAYFAHLSGKPRIRRQDPNDKNLLNVPPLVAALAGLPIPQRSDKTGTLTLPLQQKGYVLGEIGFEVESNQSGSVVLSPVYLRPLHGDVLDIEQRVQELRAVSGDPLLKEFFGLIDAGSSSSRLADLSNEIYAKYPVADLVSPTVAGTQTGDEEEEELAHKSEKYVGKEGKEKFRIHRYKERDSKLARIAKRTFKKSHGALYCECCRFDFEVAYGELGADYIEAHHRTPLSQLGEETETSIDDLALLCANCHRMVHRHPDCSIQAVIAALNSSTAKA